MVLIEQYGICAKSGGHILDYFTEV
ncbi:uncharacterized protein G2W53_018301 [Senna tora]|uniref:Uncharacterized protein n=1 Tax=Senna tora TaxID=362788 RepID=A0A834WL86_9FABA|nr:uncharacterized protein G2W53_018301 [Senna tora]